MFQTILFWYAAFIIIYLCAFSGSSEFKRFFFFSEAVWLALFASIVGANLLMSNPLLLVTAFFVLVFTACEAVTLAAILLISYESAPADSYMGDRS
jgi:hypothetical protein